MLSDSDKVPCFSPRSLAYRLPPATLPQISSGLFSEFLQQTALLSVVWFIRCCIYLVQRAWTVLKREQIVCVEHSQSGQRCCSWGRAFLDPRTSVEEATDGQFSVSKTLTYKQQQGEKTASYMQWFPKLKFCTLNLKLPCAGMTNHTLFG